MMKRLLTSKTETLLQRVGRDRKISIVLTILIFNSCSTKNGLQYPDTPLGSQVDVYHGVAVKDPYRWLEDLESDETRQWIKSQHSITEAFFDAIPERAIISEKLNSYSQVTLYRRPLKGGERYFYVETKPNQVGKLFYKNDVDAEPQLLVDPTETGKDGSLSLGIYSPSPDGKNVAYSLSRGALWHKVRILNTESKEHSFEDLSGLTWRASISWDRQGNGFYYMRFDDPPAGEEMRATPKNSRIMYHKLGTPQTQDRLIFSEPDREKWIFGPVSLTDDGKYLVFGVVGESIAGNALYIKSIEKDLPAIEFIPFGDESHAFVGSNGDELFVLTSQNAPNRRIVKINANSPGDWKTLIKEDDNAQIVKATITGNRITCWYSEDVKPRFKIFDLDGRFVKEVALPSKAGYLTTASIIGTNKDAELFFGFSSTAYPPSLYVLDSESGEIRDFLIDKNLPWNPADIAIDQVFYKGKDGTDIPMFLVYNRKYPPDGENITYMPGYGAGGWIMSTASSPRYILLLKIGGLIAIPGLRGGGEYGNSWHEAGAKLNKQNTFDDLISGAEYLIKKGYASSERLITQGLSAGGTVPAVVTNQRPDLFGFNLSTWPILDMLRYPEFTGGSYWTGEYGSPNDAEQFSVLFNYSPYHNIQEGTCYPPTLVVAGELDNTAVPSHAYKYVAALQKAQGCDNPVLLDVVWGGGHLANSSQVNEHSADYIAFWVKAFNLEHLVRQLE